MSQCTETVESAKECSSKSDLVKGAATVCIVNYKTLDLTRLCLRCISKLARYPREVIVVDNDSRDESLEYLRSLNWIRLIERRVEDGNPDGGHAHSAGLDLGLANCHTEFFVSMHSDTFVRKENWLAELIGYFDNDDNIACVGSGKVELIPQWKVILKKATDLRAFKRKVLQKPDPVGIFRYYNRTICCLYRTDVLRRERLSFLAGRDKGLTGGKKLYLELVDRGYKTVELPSTVMGQYVYHLAHATQVANPDKFRLSDDVIRKWNSRASRVMSCEPIESVLKDDSLDR